MRLKLTLASVIILLLAPFPSGVPAAETRTLELSVSGMTCAACGFAVKSLIEDVEGVMQANISYKTKTATVVYDPQRVTPAQLIREVNSHDTYQLSLPTEAGAFPRGE